MSAVRQSAGSALAPVLPVILSMLSLCLGTSYAKTLFPIAGAAGMTALRIGLGALLLLLAQRPWRWRLTATQFRAAAAYGGVLACMNMSFYAAVSLLPLGIAIAIAIEFMGPLTIAVLGSRRAIDFAWVGVAAGGVAALCLPGRPGTQAVAPLGVAFALLAALFWALYIVTGRRAASTIPQGRVVCLGLCVAAIIAVPAGVAQAGATLVRPDVLGAGLVIAILCSILPYSLEMIALKSLPAALFGVIVSLEPAIGAGAARLILGERLTTWQMLGIVAVTLASVGSTLWRRPASPQLIAP